MTNSDPHSSKLAMAKSMDRVVDLASPDRPRSNLVVPISSPIQRRPSPRVEDMTRSPRKAQRTRQRLTKYHTFDDAVELLKSRKHIVVLTGAGISTSVGIPDFRSDKGLYNKLSRIGITQPEDFFSMTYFQENPEDFFKYVREVVPSAVPLPDGTYKNVKPKPSRDNVTVSVPEFTPTHAFLSLLQEKSKLLTNYTQNIDGLERAAGLPPKQYVQCHGSWDTATCLTCGKSSSAKKYLPVVHSGSVPHCKCFNDVQATTVKSKRRKNKTKAGQKRKRANSFSDHSSDDGTKPPEPPRGLLKPDLVFFEEKITPTYHSRLESDKTQIDLLIIIGTSLKVAPIQYMLFKVNPDVPQIYISKERFSGALCSLPGVQVDIELLGECDIIIEELCRRAGWSSALEKWLWEEGQATIKKVDHSIDTTARSLSRDTSPGQDAQHNPVSKLASVREQKVIHRKPDALEVVKNSDEQVTAATTVQPTIFKSEQISVITGQTISLQEESKVKVELVEGTSHQWRITRRK